MRPHIDIGCLKKAIASIDGRYPHLDLNNGLLPKVKDKPRQAAVLVPIRWPDTCPQIMLTKRSSHLKHHPGQVAFPGGSIDKTDISPQAAALREAQEETGLPPHLVDVVGKLPAHLVITNFNVSPIVGIVRDDFAEIPESGEVEEIFHIPLHHVLNKNNFSIERRMLLGTWHYYYTVPYGPYYIWGGTARILRSLAECYGDWVDRIKG